MKPQDRLSRLCFAMFSLIGLPVSLQEKANLRADAKPHYIQVDTWTPVKLTCTLSDGDGERVPLAGCEFKDYASETVWAIGTGSATINQTFWGQDTTGTIDNQDHRRGECSLTIAGIGRQFKYIIGCRVRPEVGGAWLLAAMMVFVDKWPHMPSPDLQPSGVLVSLPGSDVTIVGLIERQVDGCGYALPFNRTRFYLGTDDPSHGTSVNTTRYRAWRDDRRCAVTLLSVQPQDSGFVRIGLDSFDPVSSTADFVELVVATPPVSPPRLSVNTTDATFQPGDMLNATCVVEGSRPVSNITWLLGGEVIREDNCNEAPAESTWRWNHDPQVIEQRLSRRLTQLDDGKELKCRAGHLALPSGTLDSNTRVIRVGA